MGLRSWGARAKMGLGSFGGSSHGGPNNALQQQHTCEHTHAHTRTTPLILKTRPVPVENFATRIRLLEQSCSPDQILDPPCRAEACPWAPTNPREPGPGQSSMHVSDTLLHAKLLSLWWMSQTPRLSFLHATTFSSLFSVPNFSRSLLQRSLQPTFQMRSWREFQGAMAG